MLEKIWESRPNSFLSFLETYISPQLPLLVTEVEVSQLILNFIAESI